MAKQTINTVVKPRVSVSRSSNGTPHLPQTAAFLGDMPAAVQPFLAETVNLTYFRETVQNLSINDRMLLIEQALVLIEQNYVHLPLKSAMHGIAPVQRLRLLRDKTNQPSDENQLSDLQFHQELLSIFLSLRDLHTNYVLPAPYNRMVAFVPFLIEEFFEGGERRYLVSRTIANFNQPPFGAGCEIVSWNGISIERAVEINGARFAGSNLEAQRARGVETMTVRSLAGALPPDEDRVILEYRLPDGEQKEELRVDWLVFSPDDAGVGPQALAPKLAMGMGMDEELHRVREARKILFAPEVVEATQRMVAQSGTGSSSLGLNSNLPDVIEAREVNTPHGTFGYIRIRTFYQNLGPQTDFVEVFLQEFQRLLEQLPDTGLIIDVRGNGGGIIWAGERLLQLFTPNRVIPEPAQFINSTLNLQLCERHSFLQEWIPSMKQSIRSGATFSSSFPITPPSLANEKGQIYYGPVILITDALCYSTTDIFAAGFQDHKIGPILGVDNNTGAGGANVFSHFDIVKTFFPPDAEGSPYRKLPEGANMRVAIRRTLRVNERAGEPVEDFGVIPDRRHFMTRNDLLNRNSDLIDHASEILSTMKVCRLEVETSDSSTTPLELSVKTKGLERLDIYIDQRPFGSVDIQDGKTELTIETTSAHTIRLEGFSQGAHVASRTLVV